MQRFRADARISASKVEGAERQRRQVERDIENVRSVIDAAIEFQQLMDQTIVRVEQFGRRHLREAA
jgi:hypothetical protein